MVKLVNELSSIKLGHDMSWSYFSTSHGIGVEDGIGGSAKSLVRIYVKARRRIVKNSLDFAHAVTDFMPYGTTVHVSLDDIY